MTKNILKKTAIFLFNKMKLNLTSKNIYAEKEKEGKKSSPKYMKEIFIQRRCAKSNEPYEMVYNTAIASISFLHTNIPAAVFHSEFFLFCSAGILLIIIIYYSSILYELFMRKGKVAS